MDGELVSQNGALWANSSSQEFPVDVTALDGTMVSITNRQLFGRPDHSLPTWIRSFPGTDASGRDALLTAVDADAGHIALLDVGRERVLWLDAQGQLLHEWSTWAAAPNALPADLALDGERVYLADRGRNRIMVRDAHGGDLGEWPTHDGPLRITVGPRGDLFVLGRGGWLLRYTPEGTLVSWWRLPHREVSGVMRAVTPGDLDVDTEGRVYASWWVEGPKDTIIAGQAGIAVFAPILRPAPEGRQPLRPGACLVESDKRAAPGRVPLGETVDVTLTLRGECPGTHRPSQVMIVFDRSRSIEWNGALLRAQDAMVDLLDTLNGEAVEIGLVSFADGGSLEVPLTSRLGEIRGRIATFDAGGDTRMAAGIDLARRELMGPRRDPDAEPHIWIVSDGVFKDQPTEAVEAALAEGIIVDALIFRTHEFDNDVRNALRGLVGGGHLHEELRPEREIGIVQQITAFDPQRGLFDTVTIDDVIPSNMRLVEGSVDPPAVRLAADTLRWAHRDVLAANVLTMTYRLEPLDLGEHPTNVEADARWVDAWGHGGRMSFPVPRVEVVLPPTPTPTPPATATPEADPVIYLPFASRYRCHRRQPLDIVLTVDTSGSMGRPVVGQPGTALDVARRGMRDFVRLLDLPRDRVAVVEFNATARVVSGLSGDRARIGAAIDALRHNPGSRLDQGLALAAHALDGATAPRGRPVVILLTDGQQYDSRKLAIAWGDGMRGRGVTVYAVGFGPTVDEELLRRLVSTPDRYHRSIGAQDLLPVYGRIGAELACPGG
jgi:Mg-chelatase subunit ChlD